MDLEMQISPMIVAIVFIAAGCGGDEAAPSRSGGSGDYPIKVETCGRQVTIEKPPEKVMTVGHEAAGLLWAAGASDRLDVIASVYSSLGVPEGTYADTRIIEPLDMEPSREVIIGEAPDLLLGYGVIETPWEDIDAAGIDQISVSGLCDRPQDGPELDTDARFEDIYADLELYGRLFGTEDAASRAIEDLRTRVASVQDQFRTVPKRTAATIFVSGSGSVLVYGGASIADDQMSALGLTNVFAEEAKTRRFLEVSVEELLDRDPEVLIVAMSEDSQDVKEEITAPRGSGSGSAQPLLANAAEARQAVEQLPAGDRLTALKNDGLLAVSGSVIIGGIPAIQGLERMAEELSQR